MRYLYGDSTESDLDFNFLAFLREVIDCAVVMLEAEVTLAANVERKKAREQETAGLIRAVEELGKEAIALVDPVAKEQPKAPVGRCAASIATAVRDAVSRESAQAKTGLTTAREEVDREDQQARVRANNMLDKLLRTHDLPGADKQLEITWSGSTPKATLRQVTTFGLEAVVALEVPAGSLLGSELRVDRIDPNVEVHAQESGGWLKKADKLVAHKLGRYQVVGVTIAGDTTTIRLRAVPDANGTGLTITIKKKGIHIEGSGNNAAKLFSIEDRDHSGVQQLADKLVHALRGLDKRSSLVSAELDKKPLSEHAHPRTVAERLITAIAPTVQKIVQHGRNPGELVLRRQLADDRREEIYVPVSELVQKLAGLPPGARAAFAPLQLGGDDVRSSKAVAPKETWPPEPKPELRDKPIEARPPDVKMPEIKPYVITVPEPKIEAKAADNFSDGRPIETPEPKPRDAKPTDTKPYESRRSPTAQQAAAATASTIGPGVIQRDKPKTVPPPAVLRPAAEPSQPMLAVKPVGSAPARPDDKDDTAPTK